MPATGTPPYDLDTAQAGLWLLQDAHDHWLADVVEMSGQRAGPEHRHLALRMHQHAASVLLWARGLDDLCGRDPDPLPSYRAARPSMVAGPRRGSVRGEPGCAPAAHAHTLCAGVQPSRSPSRWRATSWGASTGPRRLSCPLNGPTRPLTANPPPHRRRTRSTGRPR